MRAIVWATTLGLLVCAAGARADTIHVDVKGGGDYTTIQAGMNAAVTGDTVAVASGTYYITDPITYDGKEIMLRSEFNPESTVIDCQGVTTAIIWDGEGDGAILLGFTIQNGHGGQGGAVECRGGAAPTISNCIIKNCSADRGGAFYIHESPIKLWTSEITGCTATEYGGAVYCYNSTGATFYDLIIGGSTAGNGGGMYVWGGAPTVQLCTFYGNGGTGGGAIHCRATGMVMILQTILAFSTAGKGVYCQEGATPYVGYCDIFGNAGGDDVCGTSLDNGSEDPRFCGMNVGDVTLCANSGCLPGGIGMALIGARGEGCADCEAPVAQTTWGAVKALYR